MELRFHQLSVSDLSKAVQWQPQKCSTQWSLLHFKVKDSLGKCVLLLYPKLTEHPQAVEATLLFCSPDVTLLNRDAASN